MAERSESTKDNNTRWEEENEGIMEQFQWAAPDGRKEEKGKVARSDRISIAIPPRKTMAESKTKGLISVIKD